MTRRDLPFADPGEPHVVHSSPKAGSSGDENVVDLLRQLANQGSHLAEQQLNLIKTEIREGAADIKLALSGMAGAAVVGIAGLGVLLMGVAYLLGDAIDNLGVGTLIVGASALALAFLLYRSAAAKMRASHLSPDRTQRTLQRTPDAVRGNLNPEQNR